MFPSSSSSPSRIQRLTKISIVDAKKSSTFNLAKDGKNGFQAAFRSGEKVVKGDFATETLQLGDAKIQNTTMGFGTDTNIPFGILGIGYAENEAIVHLQGEKFKYDNVPVVMAKSGAVSTVAYSLWLNDRSKIHQAVASVDAVTDYY